MLMSNNNLAVNGVPSIGDYWSAVKRRKWYFLIPFMFTLYVSMLLAYGLPPVYRSQATILIERQEIPTNLVETTVTGFVQERIEALRQRLMSHERLWEIAEKLDLYPEERAAGNRQEIVKRMRENIYVEMVDVKASEAGAARPGYATIAFTVAFEDSSPEIAQVVANELAELYMSENRRQRSEQAAEVTEFLEQEAERLAKEMEESEKRLAEFKKKHIGATPELANLNLRLMEQTENKIQRLDDRIRALEERKRTLEGQLAITSPYKDVFTEEGARVLSTGERLSTLTAEYLRLSAIYAQSHPDVVKLRREITSLENQTGMNTGASSLVADLSRLREELAKAKQRYSPEHPDVIKLGESVAKLERELRNISIDRSAATIPVQVKPDNPTYISLQTQYDSVLADIAADHATRRKLEKKLAKYEARMESIPAVERDFMALTRDYDNAKKKYQEVKDKLIEAKMAEQLEAGGRSERFALIERPYVPTTPEKPNRLGIALLGSMLAFVAGIGGVAAREYGDHAVHGSKGVLSISHAPPLANIPYIENDRDVISRKKQRLRMIAMGALTLSLVAASFVALFIFRQG